MVSTHTNETILGKTPFIATVRIKKTDKRREYKSIYILRVFRRHNVLISTWVFLPWWENPGQQRFGVSLSRYESASEIGS